MDYREYLCASYVLKEVEKRLNVNVQSYPCLKKQLDAMNRLFGMEMPKAGKKLLRESRIIAEASEELLDLIKKEKEEWWKVK